MRFFAVFQPWLTGCGLGLWNLRPKNRTGPDLRSLLKYLLWGVPFNIVKAMGCWQSDTFTLYLQKHALILAPYIQAKALHIYNNFVCITMPATVC
ncbi:hypothetical protein B0H34DRAFT_663926 [Crassisporium funariophilum]|nr:hypothetical protein B0H34DRAFT_663926 [Crassisporium funariophilum]